jgi:hypothetical protein
MNCDIAHGFAETERLYAMKCKIIVILSDKKQKRSNPDIPEREING